MVKQCKRLRFSAWAGKISLEKEMQPIPVFLPGKSHGQRSLAGYNPWGHRRIRHNLATKQTKNKYINKRTRMIENMQCLKISKFVLLSTFGQDIYKIEILKEKKKQTCILLPNIHLHLKHLVLR